MDKHSRDYLFQRNETDDHKSSIRNDTPANSRVLQLIERVFNHIPAYYGTQEPNSLSDCPSSEEPLPSSHWISQQFYLQHYIAPVLRRDYRGREISHEQFLQEISRSTGDGDRNALMFLVGEVGCGKTAFLNYLITAYGYEWYEKNPVWFLRLNVDPIAENKPMTMEILIKGLVGKLKRILVRIAEFHKLADDKEEEISLVIDYLNRIDQNEVYDENTMSSLLGLISDVNHILKRRFVLILDNLDYVFHLRDRVMFLDNNDTGEVDAIDNSLQIINFFHHSLAPPGDLGANVLFVLRPDSYEIMKASKELYQGVEACFKDNRNLFSIEVPNWSRIVVERSSLLIKCIQEVQIDGIRKEYENALQDILEELTKASSPLSMQKVDSLMGHLRQISNFGLRECMEFFANYTWIKDPNRDVSAIPTSRYIEHLPVGLISFMLNNRRLYHQFHSNFPNLYLIDSTAAGDNPANYVPRALRDKWEDLDHPHTYWLKSLILRFIRYCNSKSEAVTTSSIVDMFSTNSQGGAKGYYSDKLVRLTLGSFAQNHISNLIRVQRSLTADRNRLYITNINLTARANHCLTEIFNRFFYLQIIIDDFLLPLPRRLQGRFQYNADLNYSYLVDSSDRYYEKSVKMVSRKAFQVADFLAILWESYICERTIYTNVFQRLGDRGITLPNMKDIKTNFLIELTNLKNTGANSPARSLNIDLIEERISITRKDIKNAIRELYQLR